MITIRREGDWEPAVRDAIAAKKPFRVICHTDPAPRLARFRDRLPGSGVYWAKDERRELVAAVVDARAEGWRWSEIACALGLDESKTSMWRVRHYYNFQDMGDPDPGHVRAGAAV